MNCIFCEIVRGHAEADILFEDEKVISFLDINPLNFGHTLVIPKKHYENFYDVSSEDLNSVINVAQIVSNGIKESLNTDGINIVVNNGKAAGQSVFHFHLHIIPRFYNDDITPKLQLKKYDQKNKKEFAEKIKAALNNK